MIKRILEISSERYHLGVRLDQLQLRPPGTTQAHASVPCEDIGVLLIDHPATTYTHQALTRLMEAGAAVVLCGNNHLPAGILLPVGTHTEVVWRIQYQIDASRPLKKRIWKQIIRAKIRNQARNLPQDHPTARRLRELLPQVRSGDPDNLEAQAARFYWEAWIEGTLFRRNPEGDDAVNSLLNYGYAVLRAAVARALVSAGLHPVLGLYHRNRSNPFCLADDLMEPMRPWVDAIVGQMVQEGAPALNRDSKKALLALLHRTVKVEDQTGPLLVALHRTCASLVRCLQKKDKKLLLPQLVPEEKK